MSAVFKHEEVSFRGQPELAPTPEQITCHRSSQQSKRFLVDVWALRGHFWAEVEAAAVRYLVDLTYVILGATTYDSTMTRAKAHESVLVCEEW